MSGFEVQLEQSKNDDLASPKLEQVCKMSYTAFCGTSIQTDGLVVKVSSSDGESGDNMQQQGFD